MTKIINLTQHAATPEQVAAGVENIEDSRIEFLAKNLTFDEIPTRKQINQRVRWICWLIRGAGYDGAMIGGAPYLMGPLEAQLRLMDIKPLYAFSKRESVETTRPDGSVVKTNVFKHVGFVEA